MKEFVLNFAKFVSSCNKKTLHGYLNLWSSGKPAIPCSPFFSTSRQAVRRGCCIKVYYLFPYVWFLTFCKFFLQDYATTYRATRDAYLKAANELKLATGPYKAARDAYVAATATYTKSLYE